jgi:uncharacterized membrane-anchored protein
VVIKASKSHHLLERISSYPTAPISTEEIPAVQADLPVKSNVHGVVNITETINKEKFDLRFTLLCTLKLWSPGT